MTADLRYATSTFARSVRPAFLALGVGALSAYAALGLVVLIQWAQSWSLGITGTHVYSQAGQVWPLRIVLAPCLGGIVVGLMVYWLVPGRRNHGPADVMEAVRVDEGGLRLRSGILNAATSAIAIGCGASLGRYGPSVHLGASIAASAARICRLARAERLTLIGCGVAAAISASFSAPLAGVLFAHEVMLDAFARRGFVAITIASVTGHAVARAHEASFRLASLGDYRVGFNHEFLLFALVGALGGLVAIAFVRGLVLSGRVAARVPLPQWLKPALAGALVGVVALRFPQVLGLGDEAIHDAIEQLFTLPILLGLLAAKLVLACACRGFGFPGGVTGPSLFLGAMLGSAVGQIIQLIDPSMVSALPVYALAGMGAVMSCVLGAPITTIVLVFELTGSYDLATAVMIAVVTASMVSSRVFPYSWFNLQLLERGVDVRVGREVRIMRSRRVAELISEDFHRVAASATLQEVKARMQSTHASEVLVVDRAGVLLGQITVLEVMAEIEAGGARRAASEIATMPAVLLESTDDLDSVMGKLRYFIGVHLPVVDSLNDMKVIGVVFASSVIGAYNDAVEQARAEERGND